MPRSRRLRLLACAVAWLPLAAGCTASLSTAAAPLPPGQRVPADEADAIARRV